MHDFKRKIKVALIDSSVNTNDFVPKFNTYSVTQDLQIVSSLECNVNWLHGTVCAKVILEIAPHVELICLDIFEENSSISFEKLTKAIQFAIKEKCEIINLSMTSLYFKDKVKFETLLSRYWHDAIFVTSCSNIGKMSYPAIFEQVISVVGDKTGDLKPKRYLPNTNPHIFADFIARSPESITLGNHCFKIGIPNSNSYATPVITAHIANIMDKQSISCAAKAKDLLKLAMDGTHFINLKNNYLERYKRHDSSSVVDEDIPVVSLIFSDISLLDANQALSIITKCFYDEGYNSLHITTFDLPISAYCFDFGIIEAQTEKFKHFLYSEACLSQTDIILISSLYHSQKLASVCDYSIIIENIIHADIEEVSVSTFLNIISKFAAK